MLSGDEEAFDWSHYFKFVAQLENCTPEEIEERTIKAVKTVSFCDLTDLDQPFSSDLPQCFDVIIASLVFDVISLNEEELRIALTNVLKKLRNRGFLIIQVKSTEVLLVLPSNI